MKPQWRRCFTSVFSLVHVSQRVASISVETKEMCDKRLLSNIAQNLISREITGTRYSLLLFRILTTDTKNMQSGKKYLPLTASGVEGFST